MNSKLRITELEKRLEEAKALAASNQKLAEEQYQKNSQNMGATLDNAKLAKQLKIINHIVAGRSNEAIAELLDPAQLVITFNVVYADDKTKLAAEDEMLKLVIERVCDHLGRFKIERRKKAMVDSK